MDSADNIKTLRSRRLLLSVHIKITNIPLDLQFQLTRHI